jgi:hypothetical protein
MDHTEADKGLPDISICPRCGARLLTRNLSHSCGRFSLEGLFFRSEPAVLDLARKYVDELKAWLQESHDIVGTQSDLRGE